MREDDGNYKLGHKLIETASYYINELELQTEARPYVAEISVHLGLAAYLGVLEGENVIYLEKINGPFTLKDFSQIGIRVPAYCSSLGNVCCRVFQRQDRANHGGMQFYKIHAQYDLQHGRTPQRADKSPQTGMGHG